MMALFAHFLELTSGAYPDHLCNWKTDELCDKISFFWGKQMKSNYNYDQIACFSARHILQSEGYLVEKTTGVKNLFHLIAWKGNHEILFIRIRRSRKPGVLQFSEDINQLSGMVTRKQVPGSIEFWVLINREWRRYVILPGGAVPKDVGLIGWFHLNLVLVKMSFFPALWGMLRLKNWEGIFMRPNAEICSRYQCPNLYWVHRGSRRLRKCRVSERYPGSLKDCPEKRF